ncbi:hypothetical protein [Cupriavidus sp. CP313]
MDFDASGILQRGEKIAELGDRLYDFALDVASGTRLTSEILDVRETAISRFALSI